MRLIGRLHLWLKNQRFLFWPPLIAVGIVFPLAVWAAWRSYRMTIQLYHAIVETAQMLLPLFTVWWTVFGLRTLFEGDGAEAIYRRVRHRFILDSTCLFLIYQATVFLQFVLMSWLLFPSMLFEYLRVFSLCFFSHGLVLLLMKVTAAPMLALLTHLLYVSMNILVGRTTNRFPFKLLVNQILIWRQLETYLPFIWVGLVMLGVAWILPFRLRKID